MFIILMYIKDLGGVDVVRDIDIGYDLFDKVFVVKV